MNCERLLSAAWGHEKRLHDWVHWQRSREEAFQQELRPLVEGLEKGWFTPSETQREFETAFAVWFAFTRMDAEPLLRNFMPGEHADSIERFRSVDDRLSELASRYIRARICGVIPDK